MRIAYILSTFPAISETFIRTEIDGLLENGHEIYIFAIRQPDYLPLNSKRNELYKKRIYYFNNRLVFVSIPVFIIEVFFHPLRIIKAIHKIFEQYKNLPLFIIIRELRDLLVAFGFYPIIQKLKIQHLHSHFSSASNINLFLNLIFKKKFTFTAHASDDIFRHPELINDKMLNCEFVVTVSNYNKEYLNLITDFNYLDKIFVIYNGIKVPEFIRENYETSNKIKVLSVGNFSYFKGFPTLLKSIKILVEKGYEFEVWIIGDGPQRIVIEKIINNYKLNDTVKLLGFVEDSNKSKYYKEADIFVLASEIYLNGIRDSLPTVIFEAMGYGLPVVSTYISSIPEQIIDGESGLLCPEKDANKIAEQIEKLILDKELRKKLGQNARCRLEKYYDYKNTIKSFNSLLSEKIND